MRLITRATGLSLTALLLLALSSSCSNTDPFSSGRDADGDGFGEAVDCDDNNPAVNPGASELQNCLDDNCDGQADEGTDNYDRDGDGFCISTGDVGACEGNNLRNPGVAEDGGNGSLEPNGIDDNCNGMIDEGLPTTDNDGDGFSLVDGDCDDTDPEVSPSAIEVEGFRCNDNADCPSNNCVDGYCRCTDDNSCSTLTACVDDSQCENGEKCSGLGECKASWTCVEPAPGMGSSTEMVCRDNVDNDCDGTIDELPAACDALAGLSQTDPVSYVRAIDICPTDITCGLEADCPGAMLCVSGKCTQVLDASFNASAASQSRGIDTNFAQNGPFTPNRNETMAIFSSGLALYNPQVTCPQPGTDFGVTGTDPDPTQVQDPDAYDLSQLKLELLVPSNARSFSFDFNFFSTEYPEFIGAGVNDTFWVDLQSKGFKGNISFDSQGTPIRIDNAFFDICDAPQGQPQCSQPASVLGGTGYAVDCSGFIYPCPNNVCGAATGWLTTTAPVEPGEIITLTFSIFDKGDNILDSAVIIDNFRWNPTPAGAPVTGPE